MITLIMPYYDNSSMLELHYGCWLEWPEDLKARLKVIIVDDGSPTAPAIDVPRPDGLPALSIYRVTEDRPWHQHAARNLGAHVADDGWLLLTDMDHMLTAENALQLFKRIDLLEPDMIYTLHRVEADTGLPTIGTNGKPKPHPNSFVLTKDLYWRIGGYDEDYCGVYGTDGLFKQRAFTVGRRGHLKKVALTRYWRGLVPDASTTTLVRKDGRDPEAKKAIARAKWKRGEEHEVKVLQFEWERVL
jgi:hypothetical protein